MGFVSKIVNALFHRHRHRCGELDGQKAVQIEGGLISESVNVLFHRYRGGEFDGQKAVQKASALGADGLVVYTGPPDGIQNATLLATERLRVRLQLEGLSQGLSWRKSPKGTFWVPGLAGDPEREGNSFACVACVSAFEKEGFTHKCPWHLWEIMDFLELLPIREAERAELVASLG